jgi:hypothetical protein
MRHPPRKLWIHAADSIVLNREVSASKRGGVDELQHSAIDHWPHRFHVIYMAERPLHSV